MSSTVKKRADFNNNKTNTIEHFGGEGKELSNIQGRRLYENINDDESRGEVGNLLNDVEDFEKNFNGSNFDM